MTVDHLQETSPFPLWKGIVTTAGGFIIGLLLSNAARPFFDPAVHFAVGQGLAFMSTFTGAYWLMEHWRWQETKDKSAYRPHSFLRHMVITVVLAALTAAMSHLNDAL